MFLFEQIHIQIWVTFPALEFEIAYIYFFLSKIISVWNFLGRRFSTFIQPEPGQNNNLWAQHLYIPILTHFTSVTYNLSAVVQQKSTKEFWKEGRKINENTTVSQCIDGTSILRDTVKNFDQKYKEMLENSKCQAHSVATDPMLRGTNFYFSL